MIQGIVTITIMYPFHTLLPPQQCLEYEIVICKDVEIESVHLRVVEVEILLQLQVPN